MLHRYIALLVLLLLLSPEPVPAQKMSRYRKLHAPADKAWADSCRKDILALSNEVFSAGRYPHGAAPGLAYRLLRPAQPVHGQRYPLIVVFHSSGGIGTDNASHLGVLAKMWAQPAFRKRYPVFVLAIQFPERSSNYRRGQEGVQESTPSPRLQQALQLVDSLKDALSVDKKQIYVLGFSMGASTAGNALLARPHLFAAAVCISGIPRLRGLDALKNKPIWVIHGSADNENPIGSDRFWYRKMEQWPQHRLLFWEIDSLGHEIYSPLYTTDLLPRWLFSGSKI